MMLSNAKPKENVKSKCRTFEATDVRVPKPSYLISQIKVLIN